MLIFVAFCLILAILVQTGSPVQAVLVSPFFIYGGLTVAIAIIIGNFFKRLPEKISYDLFACSALFVWFAYWKPLFVAESPIFFFFPVYFALIVAFADLFFIGQRHKIDQDSLQRMQAIVNSSVIQPWFMMACVLVTLYFENRFIQFPTFMTLLTMRYALSGCLQSN
jgi:hypothetical protein